MMFEELPLVNLGGWISVLVLFLLLVLRGLLVPRRTVEYVEKVNDKLLSEREKRIEHLQAALATEQASVTLLSTNQQELLKALDLNNSLIEGVHKVLERKS